MQRHNEIRDVIHDLSSLAWGQTVKEPIIHGFGDDLSLPGLKADIGVRGVWQPQAVALFDVRVVDTDAPSYVALTPSSVLKNAENEKKRKYLVACEAIHASFTPLCVSVDGLLGVEFKSFVKRLAEQLSIIKHQPYSMIMNWIKTKLSFSIQRATNLCIRGSRTKLRSAIDSANDAMLLNSIRLNDH